MSNLNSVTYICSAGLSSVTSAGSLGPYFALTHFLPVYDFRIDSGICDTSALDLSSLNYTSASHSSLSELEIIYNNPENFGYGSYSVGTFNSMYKRGVAGTGPLFTNTLQRNADNKVNLLQGKVLQSQVSGTTFINVSAGALSAISYSNITDIQTWNPLSGTAANWNYTNLFRVTSYSPNQSTPGIASGNYKCRIPASTGSFKFNMLAIYATRVNQFGYYDPGSPGSTFNPTLFAVVCFTSPQFKTDVAGSLNAFEANVELQFQLASSSSTPVYVNTDYFTRIPTSNTTSAYALNYDGDVVISTSAEAGSWVPRAKLTITDPEKNQLHLAHDETRYTTITTNRFKPYSNYSESAEMSVLDIDTACPDDALIQAGNNCVSTGIKSVAMGCYSSATGYSSIGTQDYYENTPTMENLYSSDRGGYTFAYGVENLSEGLASTTFGYSSSAIGFGSFGGGYKAIASSKMTQGTTYFGSPSEGLNFSYGFKTSAISTLSTIFPDGTSPSSLTIFNYMTIYGGNFAANIQTLANGNGNAAFNMNTVADGTGNTAFGMATTASGISTIATGITTLSKNILSQAHGQNTSATAILSYVYGGNAKADVNANGSFTFGSPFIYGSSNNMSVGYTAPAYRKITYNNGLEAISITTTAYNSTDKNQLTYNDCQGTFLYGLGSSASNYARHSMIFGISNSVKSAFVNVFGPKNTISDESQYSTITGGFNNVSNASYSSIIGFNNILATAANYSSVNGIYNILTSANYSNVVGFSNTLTNSEQVTVNGDNNTISDSSFSTNIGRLSTISSYSKNVFNIGYNSSILGSEHVYNIGKGNSITYSTDSYALGNNVQIAGATNSIAIGYGSEVTTKNTVQIGSCYLDKLNIISPEIMIAGKKCSGGNTKITLSADEIILDGYTGNVERYKFAVEYFRRRNISGVSLMQIKIFRARCDIYSGDVQSHTLQITSTGGVKTCTLYTRTNSKTVVTRQLTATDGSVNPVGVKYVMFNPLTMDWIIGSFVSGKTGTAYRSDVKSHISNGYRLITNANFDNLAYNDVIYVDRVEYYLFNDIYRVVAGTESNDVVRNNDVVRGYVEEYDETTKEDPKYSQVFTSDASIVLQQFSNEPNTLNLMSYADRSGNRYGQLTTNYNNAVGANVQMAAQLIQSGLFNSSYPVVTSQATAPTDNIPLDG